MHDKSLVGMISRYDQRKTEVRRQIDDLPVDDVATIARILVYLQSDNLDGNTMKIRPSDAKVIARLASLKLTELLVDELDPAPEPMS